MFARIALLLFAAAGARAQIGPSTPGTSTAGTECTVNWTVDTSATAADWKTTTIELMTGDNFKMVHLTTLGTVDGSDPSKASFSYPCPDVTPNSAIYFLQFTNPVSKGAGASWTTRWGLGDANGELTPPTEQTQPGTNAAIPWGTGALADPASAVAAPAYLLAAGAGGAAPAPAVSGASSAAGSSASAVVTPSSAAPVTPVAPTVPSASVSAAAAIKSPSVSRLPSTTTGPAPSGTGALNADAASGAVARSGAHVLLALGAGLIAFL